MPDILPITIIFSLIGLIFIVFAFLNRQLLNWIGLKPMSEVFTNPGFRRSAKITEKLGRVLFLVMGAGFLIQGAGALFLSSKIIYIVSIVLSGLMGLILLVVFGVVLGNWRAK